MHINPMKAAVERGELQIGTWVNLVRNPAILTLLKNAGLDFARIDMEHSALSIESLADMAILARALEFPIAVRPPHVPLTTAKPVVGSVLLSRFSASDAFATTEPALFEPLRGIVV